MVNTKYIATGLLSATLLLLNFSAAASEIPLHSFVGHSVYHTVINTVVPMLIFYFDVETDRYPL